MKKVTKYMIVVKMTIAAIIVSLITAITLDKPNLAIIAFALGIPVMIACMLALINIASDVHYSTNDTMPREEVVEMVEEVKLKVKVKVRAKKKIYVNKYEHLLLSKKPVL
jgi:hypothetical protein